MVVIKQVVLVLMSLIVLAVVTGCGTVNFSTSVPNWVVKKPTTGTVAQEVTTASATTPAISETYHYGRFTVVVEEGSQRVIGGIFMPRENSLHGETAKHVIRINYTTKELSYYQRNRFGKYEPVIGYAVVTPGAKTLANQEVRGRVRRIDLAPTWCPTQKARKIYPQLPSGCLAFGHPNNAMGAAKFEISWKVVDKKVWSEVHLHGSVGYPRGKFWEAETLGCTRLQNEAILNLVDEFGPAAVKEGIEVVLLRGDTDQ